MRKTKKILWIMLGFISLGVGAVGVVLPLLPSFPFLLLTQKLEKAGGLVPEHEDV